MRSSFPPWGEDVATPVLARLVEVPAGWENGGSFYATFDGSDLHLGFGDDAERPEVALSFTWVRSFRYVSEATYDPGPGEGDPTDALLSELSLPDESNPSHDHYGDVPEAGKGPPRLFRLFHYKAGIID